MEKHQLIERSIIKKYKKEIWNPFIKGVIEYKLVEPGDKIAVCLSGGKDSMLMAKCMQQLKRHGKFDFELVFLVMDPGYDQPNRLRIEENAKRLNIPIEIFHSSIFEIVSSVEQSPCYLCARMRRGFLYARAKELGCNKIALGHHMDDVIETVLLNMFYSAQLKSMMPKLKSKNFEGMELIRPMYKVKEKSIIAWKNYNSLEFIRCACLLTKDCDLEDEQNGSKRAEMKRWIREMKKSNPMIDQNIFKSVHNVHLDTMVRYKKDGTFYPQD